MRVTIIDDDRDVLDLFEDLFGSANGFETTVFAGALPGIHDLIRSAPDLMVVDLALAPEREELTGLQVIHSARSSPELRDVPIIVSYTSARDLARAWPEFMERGDIHRLEKPFDLETFQIVIDTALGRRAAGPDPAEAPRSTTGTD